MSKLLAALAYQEVFHQTLLFTSVTEPLGNTVLWDKNIFYQCCPNALTKHTSKSFRLHQAINLLVIMIQLSALNSFFSS